MNNDFFVETKTEFYDEEMLGADIFTNTTSYIEETPDGVVEIYNFINMSLNIVQFLSIILAILLILKGIYNMYKNKQNKEKIYEEIIEEKKGLYGDAVCLSNHKKTTKKATLVYFVISGGLFFIYLIINIIKNFSTKL